MKNIYLATLLFVISISSLWAQSERKRANFWHFGSNAGLEFTCPPPESFSGSPLSSIEGSASISDLNGNLLMFTDGATVWDANNNVMPNGTGLMGHQSSVQSAVIVPHPGNADRYFIFTAGTSLEDNGLIGIRFSEVDMTLNGGFGDVLAANKNTLLFAPNEEKLTAVENAAGNGYWVIGQEKSTNIWHAYEVTAAGVNTTPVTSTTGPPARPDNSLGAKFSPDGTMLVTQNVCGSGMGSNPNLTLYGFDNATGVLTFLWDDCGAAGFKLEFSPDCTKLYTASTLGIFQYDLAAGADISDGAAIIASKVQIGSGNSPLQLGNDCKIYVGSSGFGGGSSIGVINKPNLAGTACDFIPNYLTLVSGTSQQRFPNFVQSFFTNDCDNIDFDLIPQDAGCNSDGEIELIITQGVGPFSFEWSSGETTQNISGLSGGWYSVTVTDFNMCPHKDSVFINQPPTALIDNAVITDISSCGGSDGAIDLTISSVGGSSEDIIVEDFETDGAGTRYTLVGAENQINRFFKQGNSMNFTQAISGQNNLNYFGARRTTTLPAILTLNPEVITGYSNLELCILLASVGNADANDAYDIEYRIDGGTWTSLVAFRRTSTFPFRIAEDLNTDGVGEGIQLTETFQNFCYSIPATGNQIEIRVVTNAASVQSQFAFDYIRLTGIPPQTYTVLWSNGETTDDISGIGIGTYDVEITTSSGCVVNESYTLVDPCTLLASFIPSETSICEGESITFTDNSSGLNIVSWDWTFNGGTPATASTQGPHTVTFNTSGSYDIILQVEDDSGVVDDTLISITVNAPPTVSASNNGPLCTGSDLVLTATGGTNYVWSGPNGFSSNTNPAELDNISLDAFGVYTVTVTDANGCENTAQTTLAMGDAPSLSITGTDVSCLGNSDGEATVVVTGGTPDYSFSWSPSGSTSQNATGLSAGVHTVTVTDATGCAIQESITIDNLPPMTLTFTSTPSQCLVDNGEATVVVSGGTPDYTFSWSPAGGTNATTTPIGAGDYTVTVTDVNGCQAQGSVNVGSVDGPVLSIQTVENVSCYGSADGSITVQTTGGSIPYIYSWTPASGTDNEANNLSPGTYLVTVTDDAGCTDDLEITITEPQQLVVVPSVIHSTCGIDDGEISLDVTGGSGGYDFNWTPNVSTSSTASNLAVGTYQVDVTDSEGCSETVSVIVEIGSSFYLDASPDDALILQGESIDITLDIDPNIVIDEIIWTPTDGLSCSDCDNPTASPMEPTMYIVTVIADNGCMASDTVFIDVKKPCGELFVPNIFSPNKDGVNDGFCVYGSCVISMELTIFNRWGETIFYTENRNACWDGYFRGQLVQSGVYTYKLVATLESGETVLESGNVNVVR